MLNKRRNDSVISLSSFPLLCLIWVALLLVQAIPGVSAAELSVRSLNTVPESNSLRGCGGADLPSSNPAFEDEVLRLVNEIRLANGLLPLKRVDALDRAARFHATDMSEENYFSHTSHDRVNGELVESCEWSDRLRTYYTNWNLIAENIAAGYSTPQKVVDGWMNSPGHRHNILSANNWEIGVGYFQGSGSYKNYWVQDFGRRQGVYPIVINNDAPSTDDGKLTIHIYGSWEQVRLRVDEGVWSEWMPFSANLLWELKATAGLHTIEVDMQGGGGSANARDTIHLNNSTAQPELNALPDQLTFYYNTADENLTPGVHSIQPLASPVDPAYSWHVNVDDAWLRVSPDSGAGNEVVEIVPSVSGAAKGDNDQTLLTVSLRKSDGTVVAEKKITVSLTVVEAAYALYMPVISGK